jgi:CheY-like chemotaxis protein
MERALEDSGVTDTDPPVTVVVADDQSAVREGLVLLLGTLSGITVAGQAADGDAAVALVAATSPQVVLMDLNMPGCDGVAATRRITAEHPSTRVVVLTTYADDESIIGALQAGAARLPDQGRDPGRDRAGDPGRRGRPGGARPRRPAAAALGRHPDAGGARDDADRDGRDACGRAGHPVG